MIERIKKEFQERFGGRPSVYTSPGRVNLIGEHTDYNMGFVLPGAIDKAIYVAIAPNGGRHANVRSLNYDAEVRFDFDGEKPAEMWAGYPYGVVQEMRKRGARPGGFDCLFGGDIPLGAGLSSSAAVESAFGFALNDMFALGFDRRDLAVIGQMTEHNYIGVRCGIMDQFASLFGQAGRVIKLDCRSLEYELIPFDPVGCRVVLIDSMVKHSLASTEYNVRREQCEAGVAIVAAREPGVASLRDVSMQMLNECRDLMPEVVYRRCAYVIEENRRLLEGCDDLARGDYAAFGQKMYGSHEGLSKWYEVSCPELDYLVGVASQTPGVLGARMMGGGFGGCVINLVEDEAHDRYLARASKLYREKFGIEPRVIDVVIGDGSRKLE